MTRIVRLATPADVAALAILIERSTRVLLVPFLTPEQLAAGFEVMTLDMPLIVDGTYFVAEEGGVAVGCGGWTSSRPIAGRTGIASCRPRGANLPACGPCTPIQTMHAAASAASSWRPARTRRARPALPKANFWQRSQANRSIRPPDGGQPSAPSLQRVRGSTCPQCGMVKQFLPNAR